MSERLLSAPIGRPAGILFFKSADRSKNASDAGDAADEADEVS